MSANDPNYGDLIVQGVCAVQLDGKVRSTGWLLSSAGQLLTVGHVFGQANGPLTIRFADQEPVPATIELSTYDTESNLDYAVLKATAIPAGQQPLPVSFRRPPEGEELCAYGYGKTLVELSPGYARYLGRYHPGEHEYWEFSSKELGEGGFSGTPFFSPSRQGVVAMQVESTTKQLGAKRDSVLAIPLYRVAKSWPELGGIVEATVGGSPLARYRVCYYERYQRWDLSATGSAAFGARGPASPDLDKMYVPLRLAEASSRGSGQEGRILHPREILASGRHTAITGPAGCGKTTWMRWTFRKLIQDQHALPFLIELRTMARAWEQSGHGCRNRSILGYLEESLAEHGLVDITEQLLDLFCSPPRGLTSVVLLDGWDELGELGTDLRQKLQILLKDHPKVIALVTSRPFGQTRPSETEKFQELTFQHLSDGQIAFLSKKFFRHYRRLDRAETRQKTLEFIQLLRNYPEAHDLARTALLLTIVLLRLGGDTTELARSRRKLYQRCLERMLSGLPEEKEESGARKLSASYSPVDIDERTSLAASLAFGFYGTAEAERRSGSLEKSWDEVAKLLPAHWGEERRDGFILWLVENAGLLICGFDGNNIRFLHRSFQEYLAAEQLFREDSLFWRFVKAGLPPDDLWEPIIQWAGIAQEDDPKRLVSRINELSADKREGFWLAGTLFAQGFGSDTDFQTWTKTLCDEIRFVWHKAVTRCAKYWSRSAHSNRKMLLQATLADRMGTEGWLARTRYHSWAEMADVPMPAHVHNPVPLDKHGGLSRTEQLTRNPATFARRRILCGAYPIGPFPPRDIRGLLLWPNQRRLAGYRLQLLSDLTSDETLLMAVARRVLVQEPWTTDDERFVAECAHDIAKRLGSRDRQNSTAVDLARAFARSWVRRLDYPWICDLFLTMVASWHSGRSKGGQGAPEDFWFEALIHHDSNAYIGLDYGWMRELAIACADDLGLSAAGRDLAMQFGLVELMSLGRAHTRADFLRRAGDSDRRTPVERLLTQAVGLSLNAKRNSSIFSRALAGHEGTTTPPFWASLARHVARRSTAHDLDVLRKAAENAEEYPDPVNWGLQFLVRGDFVRQDEKTVNLDDLCDNLSIPHLPLVDAVSDEVEI